MNGEATRVDDSPWKTRLEGCATLLHQRTCREKMFMILASHTEPSSDSGKGAGFALAGLLGSQFAWESWKRRKPNLRLADTKLGSFLRLLEDAGIVGICALVDPTLPCLAGGRQASPSAEDPGLACFERCVLEAARRLEPAPEGETVCFVMDWRDPLASAALWHLEYLVNFVSAPCRTRLGALGFEHAQTFPPLHLAHSLARRGARTARGRVASASIPGVDFSWLPVQAASELHAGLPFP